MAVRTYSPKDVSVILGGNILSGFGEDTFIEIEYDAEDFTRTVGVDGFASRALSANTAANVSMTFAQTSPSNDILTNILKNDRSNNEVVTLLIRDNFGTTFFSASYAWVSTKPDFSMGVDVGEVTWVLHTSELVEYNFGNNNEASNA